MTSRRRQTLKPKQKNFRAATLLDKKEDFFILCQVWKQTLRLVFKIKMCIKINKWEKYLCCEIAFVMGSEYCQPAKCKRSETVKSAPGEGRVLYTRWLRIFRCRLLSRHWDNYKTLNGSLELMAIIKEDNVFWCSFSILRSQNKDLTVNLIIKHCINYKAFVLFII